MQWHPVFLCSTRKKAAKSKRRVGDAFRLLLRFTPSRVSSFRKRKCRMRQSTPLTLLREQTYMNSQALSNLTSSSIIHDSVVRWNAIKFDGNVIETARDTQHDQPKRQAMSEARKKTPILLGVIAHLLDHHTSPTISRRASRWQARKKQRRRNKLFRYSADNSRVV